MRVHLKSIPNSYVYCIPIDYLETNSVFGNHLVGVLKNLVNE